MNIIQNTTTTTIIFNRILHEQIQTICIEGHMQRYQQILVTSKLYCIIARLRCHQYLVTSILSS